MPDQLLMLTLNLLNLLQKGDNPLPRLVPPRLEILHLPGQIRQFFLLNLTFFIKGFFLGFQGLDRCYEFIYFLFEQFKLIDLFFRARSLRFSRTSTSSGNSLTAF